MTFTEASAMDARANPFRGLFWGCFISSLLWVGVITVGIHSGRWIMGFF